MEPGGFYHICTRANGSDNLFRTDDNYRFFLQRYASFIPSIADTYCYCLMPNHLHLLVRIKDMETVAATFGKFETFQKFEYRVSKQFSNLFSSYTQAFNKVFKRKGSLFIPNFKRKAIEDEEHFTKIIHYIHANPVHHGFAKSIGDWKWSSYQSLLSGKPTMVMRQEVLTWFGGREEFIDFHRQPVDLKLANDME
ncbi:MAG TPA: hypothetical protein VNJ07_04055 [Chitinophagales bacterium]|nr:hypothetical protein [Chitinophagales bacterium]